MDGRINTFDHGLDEIQQDNRQRNLIISGLDADNAKQSIINCVNKKLHIKIGRKDIKLTRIITPPRNPENKLIKVRFYSEELRDEIYRKRTSLKGTQIFLNEDLTRHRAELLKITRQYCRGKEGTRAYTEGGAVYLSTSNNDSKPIRKPQDLPSI